MLSGIKIVEIEGLGPAPFASMLLADLGADVVVIHRKAGNDTPGKGDVNLLDRGKRSIALDLKDSDDLKIAQALIAQADGLIEGFRPGVMERLGLGPEQMQALNPALVYGRMTGWGQTGPRADQAGHDLNYIGLSGALWYAGAPDDAPITPATLVGDIGGGAMYLAVGMLAGLLSARTTGRGTVVDAAIVDGSAHMMNLLMALRANGGMTNQRGQSLLDGPHWSRSYRCADGGYMSVQCLEPKFYAEFLQKMGLSEDADFAKQFDKSKWPTLTDRLTGIFAIHPRDHWAALFAGSDACAAPVLSPDESRLDPHMAARQIWGGDYLQASPAPRFDGAVRPLNPIPTKGQHTDEILTELGLR